jgi:hypothetical protein
VDELGLGGPNHPGRHIAPWAEWREDKKCLGGLMPEGRAQFPEGRSDRSLARSAWNSPTPKEPSRRARYEGADLIPEVFRRKGAPTLKPYVNG